MHVKLNNHQWKIVCLYVDCYTKPHGKHKPKIYSKYTYENEKRNPNTTLKVVIKSQDKRTKEEGKKKDLQKQIQNN